MLLFVAGTSCHRESGTVWFIRDARDEKTFLSFTGPPVLYAVQEYFHGADTTNPLSRGIEDGLRARWYAVDVYERV